MDFEGPLVGDRPRCADSALSVAPMLAVSNTHFRNFIRCLTRRTQLWTEMVTDQAILHNPKALQESLGHEEIEQPLVCQLGGHDPKTLVQAARYVEELGFSEINLNVGCPSSRVVEKGCFGAALMRTPELVRDIVYEIKRQVHIPVTVKTRIGYDHNDTEDFLADFIETVAAGGCQHFVIHARKAWLKGVDPKKNRSVPPLRYDRVYFLCKKFPDLDFTLNGGIQTLEAAKKLLAGDWSGLVEGTLDYGQPGAADLRRTLVKGVMIGRAAANDPCVLASADSEIYGTADPDSAQSRQSVLEAYCHYLEQSDLAQTSSVHTAMKPVLGIFNGMPGQRLFRYAIGTPRTREHRLRSLRHHYAAVRSETACSCSKYFTSLQERGITRIALLEKMAEAFFLMKFYTERWKLSVRHFRKY